MAFYNNAAISGGSGSGGSTGGRCVNDNCQSRCDAGNTIWGTPGNIKKCCWGADCPSGRYGWMDEEPKECPDSMLKEKTKDWTIHKWVKGGEDVSTRRCWNVACKNEGEFFPGTIINGQVQTDKCLPCGATKKIAVGAEDIKGADGTTTTVVDGSSQLTFHIVPRT